ncbi:MAG: hypothetical protein EOP02_00910 [Proteobacteria bacterium]|nr:MAG: hypothetical protein EOP02_00910 [Pseudomonadota bacterium]
MATIRRFLSSATAAAADARYRSIGAMIAHKRRCSSAGPLDTEAINRMISDFHASGGAVTTCPTVYVLPVQNGTGRTG